MSGREVHNLVLCFVFVRQLSTRLEVKILIYATNTAEESTGVLRKAESEYKGRRSFLSRTQNLLSTM